MKKLSMMLMLAFVCGSFAMAQTSNVSKKATLMADGAVVTDLKTGEVQRTTGAPVSIDQLNINGSNNTSISISGGSTNGAIQQRIKPIEDAPVNELITQPDSGTPPAGNALQFIKPSNTSNNILVPVPVSGSTPPQANPNIVKPPVNSNQTFTVDPN